MSQTSQVSCDEKNNVSTAEGQPSQQKFWFKRDGTWYWKWEFGETHLKIVDEDGKRELLVYIRNDLSKEARAVALVPRRVIEDLYKDLVVGEIGEMQNQLAILQAKLMAAETLAEELSKINNQHSVVVSEEEEEVR